MNIFSKGALAAASVLALTATTASAEIVCNEEGDCWHVRERHVYRPEFGVNVYPDDLAVGGRLKASAIDGASMKVVATGATASGSSSKYLKAASFLLDEEPPTCLKACR